MADTDSHPPTSRSPSLRRRAGRGEILSETSAMPGSSYSLPARSTCPGAILAPNSVCTTCYADGRKRYRWRAVQEAQARRLAWTLDALASGRFAAVVADRIASRAERHFRLHDAGDFFSPDYVDAWRQVAHALPEVSFWAPTRSWAIHGACRTDDDPLLASLRLFALLPNVVVRPSALFVGDLPPTVPGLAAGSTVTTDPALATCPKSLVTPAACGPCRVCWEAPLVPVTYLRH